MPNNDMNKNSNTGLMILLLVLVIGGILVLTFINSNYKEKTDNGSDNDVVSDEDLNGEIGMIKVEEPKPNTTVKSPLKVKGEARGNWYFEGSFPISIVDESGNELTSTFVQANGEWTTENFVPFEKDIEFDSGNHKSGVVLFKKDNPSGLPENDQVYRVPVKF